MKWFGPRASDNAPALAPAAPAHESLETFTSYVASVPPAASIPAPGPRTAAPNIIDARTFVKGDLRGCGFRIDGTVDGLVDSDGPVYVGEHGVVNGCIRASELVILGRVEGDIEASGHLEVGPKGRVIGDIAVTSFHMHRGGFFRGVSRMVDESVPETAPGRGTLAALSAASPLVSQERLLAGLREEHENVASEPSSPGRAAAAE